MNTKGLFIIFAVGLLAVGTMPVFSQSNPISDNVVINEIDTNPPGDDSQSISEWVELYNPTDSEIDIGGWEVASTTILKKTLTIPEGTTIEAGQFKTFSYVKVWFPDVNELVQLRDSDGVIVDQTPTITDLDNDFSSWQRIYDGYDTDSSTDWTFETSSTGNSNGKLEVTQEEEAVTITLTTDKSEYLFGQYAMISGSVSEEVFVEKPTFGAATIEMTVNGPNYYKQFSLYPDLYLNYDTSISLQKVLGVNEGIYDISVEYAGATAETKFSVGDEIITIEEEEDSELSISFDQDSYIPGQTAFISGKTTEISQFEGLKFKVVDPDGNQIFDGTLYPNGDGEFSTNIYMTTVSPTFGTHTITADYAGKSATSSFELLEEFIEDKPISLFTDKAVYGLGETVEISGRLNNLWIFSMDLEIQQVGSAALDFDPLNLLKELGAVRLEGDSTFTHQFEIANNPDRYGEYRVKVSKDVGQEEVFFKVVENPDTYQEGEALPLTVYTDKTTYDQGERFSISGRVNQIASSSTFYTNTIDITITSSDGGTLESAKNPSAKDLTPVEYTLTAVPDIAGNYMIEDTLYGSIYDPGTYTIQASYADGTYMASNTFSIIDPLDIGDEKFQLDINKEVFGLNEQVVVDGIVPGLSQGSGVTITLFKPDGDTDEFGKLADQSRFSWTWQTPIAEKTQVVFNERDVPATNYGVYQVMFSTDSGTANIFFKVSPNPETDSLNVLPIEVTTDRPVYNAGENVVISGVAQKRAQGSEGLVVEERAKITVKQTVGPFKELYDAFLYLDNGGNFDTILNLPVTVFDEGTYKVTAFYENHRAETIFTVDNEFEYGGDEDLALLLETDKDEYHLGDLAQITGRLNKLVYLEKVDITIVHEDEAAITCGSFVCGSAGTTVTVVPTASGAFNYDYQIPTDDSSKGNYEILADTEFGTFNLAFNVTEAPPVESKPASTASRVTEKFNRIPDTDIPITVGEVTQDETKLAPRTIQGSLFTPARGEESSVNIKVVSEGGICVIGPVDECLVSESTRAPGQIYKIVEIDGKDYKVRYSGPDVRLEKFTILPFSEDTIHIENWDIQILKDDQPSRFYYKVTRIAQE